MDNGVEERLIGSEAEVTGDLKGRVWKESKTLWRIAFPAILSRMALFGVVVVTQAFIGHIGELELATFSLVQTILVRFVMGISIGMSNATETLCGQAYGARQYHMLGIYLQRSWIVSITTTTICVPLFIFATPIFRLLGEEEDMAREAGTISLWFIPILYSTVFNTSIQMYLQAQLRNIVIIWLTAAQFLLHVLLSWVFVNKLNFGIPGAMGTMVMTSWLLIICEFMYIFGGWCPETWRGFTLAAFSSIWPVIKLSVSSGVMICLEVWYNSVLVLLAGYMQNAKIEVSTFSICLNITTWELMIGLGFMAAASVRVSNELGRGNTKAAKFAIKVIISTGTCVGVFFAIICSVYSYQIASLFTSSAEIEKAVSGLSVPLALSVFLYSIQPALTGVAIGAGWQGSIAFVNVGCYYVIGVPIGALLGYVALLQVKGIWIGMIFGVTAQVLVVLYMTWRTDWDVQVTKTSERLRRWLLPLEESNQSSSHTSVE